MSEIKSPGKAIRAFCVECMGGSAQEVRNCTSKTCQLRPFRFGKNPFRIRRELTEDQKNEIRDRLKKARSHSNIGKTEP